MHRGCVITVGELGEFGVISRISGRLSQGPAVLLGPGDDAAVLRAPDGRVVVTTDILIEGRHFRRDWSSGYDIGRKAAAQNLADIAAMGAEPTSLVVGLGLPAETSLDWLDALTDGFRDECALAGTGVAGGDIARSEIVMLGVTALGDLGGRPPVTRSGARPGHVVAVTGRLGYAAAGLALLRADLVSGAITACEGVPDGGAGGAEGLSPGLAALVDAHRRPQPPYAQGPEAARLGATAMLDVSDGLLQDLGHIAEASGVAIRLDPAALPLPEILAEAARALGADQHSADQRPRPDQLGAHPVGADSSGVDPLEWVLTGGDDHALAATFPPDVRLPPEWTPIGHVTDGQGVQVAGRRTTSGGWDHFRG